MSSFNENALRWTLLYILKLILLCLDMERGINDAITRSNVCLTKRHKTHTHILDNVSGRKGQILHLLGVDLLGLRNYRKVSVVNGRVKQREQTEYKTRAHLTVLVLGVDEVDLVVRADVSVLRKLTCHINSRVYKALVALCRYTLYDNHILVLLNEGRITGAMY